MALLASKEFGDRLRSGWVVACVLLWLGAIGLTSFCGLLQIGHLGIQGYERTVVSLLNLVQYLVPLLALLLGFDLVVTEREEQTLRVLLATGVSRMQFLLGKFLGGCLTLLVPLALGFAIAGTAIGLAAHDRGFVPFLKLAVSGLILGVLFLSVGMMISAFSRTRIQALVFALLVWCLAVFVFDLAVLGVIVSTQSASAAREIDFVCDATHVNTAADMHSAYDAVPVRTPRPSTPSSTSSVLWLGLNPVDLFRAANLPETMGVRVPGFLLVLSSGLWLMLPLSAAGWRLRKIDL